MGHKFSSYSLAHHQQEHAHQQHNNSSSNSSSNTAQHFHHNNSLSVSTSNNSNNSSRNSRGGGDSVVCQACKDTNVTCVKNKQERRFRQFLMICQAFEEQYPEVWKQFVIQYYLTANFKFPPPSPHHHRKKSGSKFSSSHDSAPGKLGGSPSSSVDEHHSNAMTTHVNNNSFKVSSSFPYTASNETASPAQTIHVGVNTTSSSPNLVHHSYSLSNLSDNPNSNVIVNSNDAMITTTTSTTTAAGAVSSDKIIVHLPNTVRKGIEKIDRMCTSQDFDISENDDDMFPNVDIGDCCYAPGADNNNTSHHNMNISVEGGCDQRNPHYGQVMDQFMNDFVEYNLKHWKIPNKMEEVNMVKIFEDFLKHLK